MAFFFCFFRFTCFLLSTRSFDAGTNLFLVLSCTSERKLPRTWPRRVGFKSRVHSPRINDHATEDLREQFSLSGPLP